MKSFIILGALLTSTAAFGWGNTGHRVVGEIAQKFLDAEVQFKVYNILGGASLARVSTWPDEIKSEPQTYQHTYNWHYTTWSQEAQEHGEEHETHTTGFLLKSINENVAVLKDPKATDDKKAFSIKFLVHLIGDLHQPLHVGNGTDLGGNACKVIFHGRATNLHALWDEGMIDFTNLSFTEIARFIMEGVKVDSIMAMKNGAPLDWARESHELVPKIYPADVTPLPQSNTMRSFCKKDVLPEEVPKLAYDYSYKFMPVVEKRLLEAGVRLAVLLNSALK